MKRPAVFITYFQIPLQIVHIYQVLQYIWILFSKTWWPFQFNILFFDFQPLFQENLWKDLPILWLIFKLPIIMSTLPKFCHLKILLKKWRLFQNVKKLLFISTTLNNICDKIYQKTYPYFDIFWNFRFIFTYSQNFIITKFFKKNSTSFKMLAKSSLIQQLWIVFFTKIWKNLQVL